MEAKKIEESQVYGYVLGGVIRASRERQGLSQTKLAEAAGISQAAMSRIENGQPPDAYLFGRIASALGMSLAQLNDQVRMVMERTKLAAAAASKHKPAAGSSAWDQILAVAGIVGLLGLITFAIAAVLAGDDGQRR